MWVFRSVEAIRNWFQRRWEKAALWQMLLAIPLLFAFLVLGLASLLLAAPFTRDVPQG